ncbi:MAG: ferrous iron transport protein B [Paludibacter sp.]|nr:ferrous iron transport protein B [Bacteroidales bacterium]MCM1069993.1 ferrous iron transport protein B [Prevotella sp.]MCM1354729.1 ferrous iron transport protein B [Bacteroides sp.]MCM1443597.1 ferrous iron transport protein B [Muribaculum sp.]MCM1482672.1 ferrous iron transport protein B [Paludibacter sp.]
MEDKQLTLADLQTGERCMILKVHGHGGFRHRILELGFVRGEEVRVLKNAPLMDPVEYEIMGSHVSLRRAEAHNIEVVSLSEEAHPDNDFHGTIEEHVRREIEELSKEITVALVGNPNCGKTSFFNYATGMREKVGNYSGVTVDSKVGTFHHWGYTINLVDLPGTYSLTEYSPEELYVRDFLDNQPLDLVLNIVNAGQLERNLFLTTQLIDRNHPMVMALNMYDELKQSGDTLDYKALQSMLGFPIVPVIARNGWGIENVLEAIVQVYEGKSEISKHIHINYGTAVESAIEEIKLLINKNEDIRDMYHPRYVALKLIENDGTTSAQFGALPNGELILATAEKYRRQFEKESGEDIASYLSDLKFGFIRGALSETFTQNKKEEKQQLGYALDKVLTNRWLGFPILFVFLFLMFEATFVLGTYPQNWIETGVELLGGWLRHIMPIGMFTDLLVDGVVAGMGAVLVFVPQILILFFFISLLEDTGYMARAAFIMDKMMHKMGLHGKSFIPYIIGFGCSVPAVLATRTLENPKDRILTVLTVPFISCSARLPVYLVLVAAFFPKHQALVLLSIYLIGLLVAILTSLVLSRFAFRSEPNPFVMELPPYRIPTMRNALIHMWDKAKEWFSRVLTIVLLASVLIWALGYFPRSDENLTKKEQLEQSLLGTIGHTIEPVFAPLGFEWRAGVSLVAGSAAKEVIASSMAVLYGVEEDAIEEDVQPLAEKLATLTDDTGNRLYTPVAAYSLLLFILLYFPCLSTLATIRKEIGAKWMWFSMVYSTGLAWCVSFVFFQVGSWLIG